MKKRLCALLAVLIGMMLSASCLADSVSIRIQNDVHSTFDNSLEFSLYSSVEPTFENLTLSIDGMTQGISSIDPLVNSDASGTTWVFLIDTSTISTNRGAEPIQKLITGLVDMTGENDTLAIISSSNKDIKKSEPSGDKETWKSIFQNFDAVDDNVSLNNAISDSISLLSRSADNIRPRACLVVISKGTNLELDTDLHNQIASSSIAVYTVAIDATNTNISNSVSNYFALAEKSAGGKAILQDLNAGPSNRDKETAVNTIISEITSNENNLYVVKTHPLSGLSSCNTMSLSLTVIGNRSTTTYSDSYNFTPELSSSILSSIAAGFTPVPTETPSPTDMPAPTATPIPKEWWQKMDMETILIISIALLIVFCVVIIIVTLLRRNKTTDNIPGSIPGGFPGSVPGDIPGSIPGGVPSSIPGGVPPSIPGGIPGSVPGGFPPSTPGGFPPSTPGGFPPSTPGAASSPAYGGSAPSAGITGTTPVPPAARSGVRVTLTQIAPTPGASCSAMLTDELIAGRDPSLKLIVAPSDHKISNRHIKLVYVGSSVYLEDLSRNGTLVNGIKVEAPVQLHSQDIINMGSSRFRISW